MPVPVTVFRNILRLEEHKGYTDTAVSGGLEAFARRWADQLVSTERHARPMAEAIASMFGGYSRLMPEARRDVVQRAAELVALFERGVRDLPVTARDAEGSAAGNGHPPTRPPDFRGFEEEEEEGEKERQNRRLASKPGPRPPVSASTGIAPAHISGVTVASQPASDTGMRAARRNPTPDSPVTVLRGVQSATARLLARLGIYTVRDALLFFPVRYDDFSDMRPIAELRPDVNQTVVGTVWDVDVRQTRNGRPMVTATITDSTGLITATWFNQEYLARQLHPGDPIVISGKPTAFNGRLTFTSPEWEPYDDELLHTGRIVPVYRSTEGLYRRTLRRIMYDAVERFADQLTEYLPEWVRRDARLVDLTTAIRQIHFPDSRLDAARAAKRLAFDEFLLIQLGMLQRRRAWQEARQALPMAGERDVLEAFISSLPFELTGAQKRVIEEILADMARPVPMTRLLQGDVGSGKTVVAAAALLVAVANGAQGAIMAPTEILAEQHYKNITRMFEKLADVGRSPVVRLLKGSTPRKEKQEIYEGVAAGEVDIVVGTHALIQEGLAFRRLGLVVVDEQHRFGVLQRDALRQKGLQAGLMPHTLVMTATPIPRSLALTVYGDLEVSVLDEMPPGRRLIKTRWVDATRRQQAYDFIEKKVAEGRQAFIICPLIEESEKIEAKAAVAEYERLKTEVFPNRRLALLHGRMKPREKEEVMAAFNRGEADILVSTSVVEVGIDVPNATVMLVEGADRFGLAQLHQFRGRVGRGQHQSYCILLADDPQGPAFERMQIIQDTHDGFRLAEADLEIRGPGEFFGTRQSGMPDLRMAKLSDMATLSLAREQARALFERDPDLSQPEHAELKKVLEAFWSRAETDANQ